MIKLCLFDWGGVCADYDFNAFLSFVKTKGYSSEDAEKYFMENGSEFNTGVVSERFFWNGLKSFLHFKGKWKDLADANAKIVHINKQLIAFIEKIKKNNKTALLSNINKTSLRELKKQIILNSYFSKTYFSSELMMSKLNGQVVERICSDFHINPKEILFIDDNDENITHAKKYGMKTILHTDTKKTMKVIGKWTKC